MSVAAPSFLPTVAVLELTYRCNHGCLFCSCPWESGMLERKPEMDTDEWKSLILEMCAAGVNTFAFTGGESLLRDDLEELIRFTMAQECPIVENRDGGLQSFMTRPSINLLTNGRLMSERILDLCKAFDIHLSISLPGLETFQYHTASNTEPLSILKWFQRAKELDITTTAGITVTQQNFHELADNIAMALVAGASNILLNRFLPGGRGLAHRELELSPEQTTQMVLIAEGVLKRANRKGSVGTELPYCVMPKDVKLEQLSVSTNCGAAVGFFVVGPSGYLRVCNHSPVEIVHWKEWRTLKDHPYWKRFIFKDYLPDMCSDCADRTCCDGGCRAAAHVTFGSEADPDPVLRFNAGSVANPE